MGKPTSKQREFAYWEVDRVIHKRMNGLQTTFAKDVTVKDIVEELGLKPTLTPEEVFEFFLNADVTITWSRDNGFYVSIITQGSKCISSERIFPDIKEALKKKYEKEINVLEQQLAFLQNEIDEAQLEINLGDTTDLLRIVKRAMRD